MTQFACWINRSPKPWRAKLAAMIRTSRAPFPLPLVWPSVWALSFSLSVILFLPVTIHAASPGARGTTEDSSGVHWVMVDGAQVKLSGKIPIMWNLYQPDKKEKKKDNLALVLLGRRYLMLDTKGKLAYEVKLADLHAQGKDFTSGDLAPISRVIPTTDWSIRDVGPAELIDLTLGDYGGALEVQIPHPLILTPPLHYVY